MMENSINVEGHVPKKAGPRDCIKIEIILIYLSSRTELPRWPLGPFMSFVRTAYLSLPPHQPHPLAFALPFWHHQPYS